MTATHAKESQDDRNSSTNFQRLKEFKYTGLIAMDSGDIREFNAQMKKTSTQTTFDRCFSDKLKRFTEIESSEGSSTEEEYSPKSVEGFGLKYRNSPFVHHQVLKIREEDSHIGEDIRESFNNSKDKLAVIHLTSQVRALILSRPILPSSPLSGKKSIKSFH